jgi:isocitrate lyase
MDRWEGIERPYTEEDVARLRGTFHVEHTLARMGAERLWRLLAEEDYVAALGAMTGGHAVQMVKAGLRAIYLSGWQVAADANLADQVYPDQSLYPATSGPALVRRINNALRRADQIEHSEESGEDRYWMAPIVADAEAGFGGPLNAFELMKAYIEAGAAGVHFEDQLAAEKKCGHLGGKVLVPTSQFIRTLAAARLAADVCDVPTLLVARTDALSATLLTSDVDERDVPFVTGERTAEGFFVVESGLDSAIARGLAYAPYADLIWFETSTPDMEEARAFAEAIHERFPDKLLAYNCSPSFNWKRHLDDDQIARFQQELGALGYRFRLPRPQLVDVRAGERLPGRGDERLRAPPGTRVRARGRGLHGDPPPAGGRRRLLRSRRPSRLRRRELHARAQGLHRRGSVPEDEGVAP